MNHVHEEKELDAIKSEVDNAYESFNKIFQDRTYRLKQLDLAIKRKEKSIAGIAAFASEQFSTVDKTLLSAFLNKPYVKKPWGKNKILVFVPKWYSEAFDFHIGWFLEETDEYYIFELSQQSAWFGDVPQDLLNEIELPEGIPATVENNIVKFKPEDKKKIKDTLGKFLVEYEEDQARITKGHEFEIINWIVESGRLPFQMKPVSEADRRPGNCIKLLEHQKGPMKEFFNKGAVGFFHPTGSGKSFMGMYAIERIVGPKIIVVPGITVKDQWNWYIEKNIPHLKDEINLTTYQGYKDDGTAYALAIFDECHRLPANSFSRLAAINTKYRIGLSASPFREDGRSSLIITLTGYPQGINWPKFMKDTGRKYHPIVVTLIKFDHQKRNIVKKLLDPTKKTLIFCDSIVLGKHISDIHNIPHIHGETTDRKQIVEDNKAVVISRVGDMGLDVPDLQRIIEIDFLYGSRQQQLQRTGRLMHSTAKDQRHDIVMTTREYSNYSKRLWALTEKGFHVKVVEN